MRVLVVSQYFCPKEFRINEVTKTLVKKGVHVDVLTGQPNYPEGEIFAGYRLGGCQQERYYGVGISQIPLIARGKKTGIFLAFNYLTFIISGLVFRPWLKRGNQYDVIFVYGLSQLLLALPALFLGWAKKVPLVVWVQDLWPQSLSATGYIHNPFLLWAVERVVRFIYRNSDLLLVQPKAFVEAVRVLASGTPVKYCPNSVDGNFAAPAMGKLPNAPDIEGRFSVIFAGNLGAAQAVEVIVEAATLLKDFEDFQFLVLGDSSRRQAMMQQVADRNLLNLYLPPGRFSVKTMPGFMQQASVFFDNVSGPGDLCYYSVKQAAGIPSCGKAYHSRERVRDWWVTQKQPWPSERKMARHWRKGS